MEYKLLEEKDLALMREVMEDDRMEHDPDHLQKFIDTPNAYGFAAKTEGRIIGFAYAYRLVRPDGKSMFYLHSIGMLPQYRNSGYGTQLLSYIKEYSRSIGCSEMFVITDKGNPAACHVYEKLGGKSDHENEIVYVYDYE